MASNTATKHRIENALVRKDKIALPMTLGLLRFRPSKPAFIQSVT